jgi:uncharacterized membrane protein
VERITSEAAGHPPATRYQRLLGWHAPPVQRVLVAGLVGVLVGLSLSFWLEWELAVLLGWDVGAIVFLNACRSAIRRRHLTREFVTREDENRREAVLIVLGACLASLFAVGFTLGAAGREHGGHQVALIAGALGTVVLSWTVVNTVFTLRYADLHYNAASGIDFGSGPDEPPDFRDFAYLAFTIGMCYQVSDTTLRDRKVRGTVLVHSVISYVFGVVIIAAAINLVAGLLQ